MGLMQSLSGGPGKSLRKDGLWDDKRGVSAVEFALLAPLLLLMYKQATCSLLSAASRLSPRLQLI